jgi:pyroglutamyl-peptidase
VPANPTQALVEHLSASPALLPSGTRLALLDVAYQSTPAAIDGLLDQFPATLVLTGYSHRATGVTLEACATTLCAADKPDVMGYVAAPLAGDALTTPVDLTALAATLVAAGLPAEISRDAGQYLCNYVYRHALAQVAARALSTQVLFVHLPAISETPLAAEAATSLPLADMARAVALLVEQMQAGCWCGAEREGHSPPV